MAFSKFFIGSLLTNSLGYFVFILLAMYGCEVFISLAFAYLISFINAQFINSFFVFKQAERHFRSLIINFSLYVILYFINIIIIYFGLSHYQVSPFESQFCIMLLLIIFNYFIQKFIFLNGLSKRCGSLN
jgi:putative flippase GtrA